MKPEKEKYIIKKSGKFYDVFKAYPQCPSESFPLARCGSEKEAEKWVEDHREVAERKK